MESSLKDLNDIQNSILNECDKMIQYGNIIKNKIGDIVSHLKGINTKSYHKEYASLFDGLNQKLIKQNSQFELFFYEIILFNSLMNVRDVQLKNELPSYNIPTILPTNDVRLLELNCETTYQPQSCIQTASNNNTNVKRGIGEIDVENFLKEVKIKPTILPTNDVRLLELNCETTYQPQSCIQTASNNNTNVKRGIGEIDVENFLKIKPMLNNQVNFPNKTFENHPKIELENRAFLQKDIIANLAVSYEENCANMAETHSNVGKDMLEFQMNSNKKIVETQKKSPSNTNTSEGLNVQDAIQTWIKNSKKEEKKSDVPFVDLRAVVVAKDIYEGTFSSKSSALGNNLINTENSVDKKLKASQDKNNDQPLKKKSNEVFRKGELSNDNADQIVIKRRSTPKEGDLCYVSHIETPSEFYIQVITEDSSLLDYLSDQIVEVLPKLKIFPTKLDAKKVISDYCVCYIRKTNCWYRAKIKNWLMESDELISVQLVDYGNSCFVYLQNIREAIPYFFALHIMAIKCKLAWIKPPENAETWPEKSIKYFRKFHFSNEECLYYFSHVEEDSHEDMLIVDLQNNEMTSLAGNLVYHDVAELETENVDNDIWCNEFMKEQLMQAQGFNQEELNLPDEERLRTELENDNEEHINLILDAAYKPKDEVEICRIFLARGYCFKGDNCKFSHIPLNPDGYTTDQHYTYYEAFNLLELPRVGEITVEVISLVDLKTYYVIVKNLAQIMMPITQPAYNIKSLVKLMNQPAEIKRYKPFLVKPANGELVLVKCNNINWQRGRILDCYEYGNRIELDVFLVDFGIVLKRVNMTMIREIEEKHLHIPFQVTMCCLANAIMKENITEEENEMGLSYLESNILNKKLKARIIYSSSYLNVHLYTEDGRDVGEELITTGLVERCPAMVTLKPNNILLID